MGAQLKGITQASHFSLLRLIFINHLRAHTYMRKRRQSLKHLEATIRGWNLPFENRISKAEHTNYCANERARSFTVARRYVGRKCDRRYGKKFLRGARHDVACEWRRVTQGQTKTACDVSRCVLAATCAGVDDGGGGARRRFSTGRIAKWQPAGLLYVQEIYRPWPFRPSQRAAEVAMATDRRKPAPTLLFPRMQAVGPAPSLALFASSDSVAPSCSSLHSHPLATATATVTVEALLPFFLPVLLFARVPCLLAASSPRSLFRFSNVVASRRAR